MGSTRDTHLGLFQLGLRCYRPQSYYASEYRINSAYVSKCIAHETTHQFYDSVEKRAALVLNI